MPDQRRWAARFLVEECQLFVRLSCSLVKLSRRQWYRADPKETQLARDRPIIDELNRVVEQHVRWGFWKCFYCLRQQGHPWNFKRVWRVYTALKLNQKRRTKVHLPKRTPKPLGVPAEINHTWSFDFMSDALYHGRRFRVLNVLDEGVREALDIIVDTSLPAGRVVRVLEQLKKDRGLPKVIRVDNGPEMTSHTFVEWCEANGIEIAYIEPGKPNQNAYIERFNRSYRTEVLDPYLFNSLKDIQEMSWA